MWLNSTLVADSEVKFLGAGGGEACLAMELTKTTAGWLSVV